MGGILGGVLGWHFTRSRDKSLGGPYKQAVATDNEKCSDIGNEILSSNGSAVDAAIAAMFCLGVINMQSSGIGGGGVMMIYNRTLNKSKVIDFKGTAPAATTSDMFPPNEIGKNMSIYGKCYFSSPFLPPQGSSPEGEIPRRHPKVIDFRETAPGATTSHMFPPEKTREDMSKRGLLCSFFFVCNL